MRFPILGLLIMIMSVPLRAQAQPKWRGSIVKEGNFTIIKNPTEPIYKNPILELKEELSLGGPEAQGEAAFGRIQSVVVNDSGSIYVLDRKNYNIKVFDPSGNHIRTFGRQGQGPGEFEYPYLLLYDRTSGELVLHQPGTKLSWFRTDGTHLRDLSLWSMMTFLAAIDSKGSIYVMDRTRDGNDVRYWTKKLKPDGSLTAVIAEAPGLPPSNANPFMAISYFAVDRADNLVYGYPLTYEISFYGPSDHKVFKRIEREYDPIIVTESDKAGQKKTNPAGTPIIYEFSKYHSAYRRFFMSDLGHLFVETWEPAPNGMKVHDIFDAEGRFLSRIPLKPTGITILKGKYYALEEDEDGYQYIKRYRVVWKDLLKAE